MLEPISEATIQPLPHELQKVCDDWNQRARKAGDVGFHLSIRRIARPSGRTNHHVRILLPNGAKDSLSLGVVSPKAVRAAARSLLAKHRQNVHFEF